MSFQDDVDKARRTIVKDGFDMSIGELISIYEKEELIINPAFQRCFRWGPSRKTRFIETLLLGIPIPPIFVFTDEQGRWELIDGLQRLSTIYEYAGILRSDKSEEPNQEEEVDFDDDESAANAGKSFFIPNATKLLPTLEGVTWDEREGYETLPFALKLDIKRVRIRVEILKRESDTIAKYELFQRLNTGGASLSEQEIRNCIAVMISPPFYHWMESLAENEDFQSCVSITEWAQKRQKYLELVLRFLAFRYKKYKRSIDVHDWLDNCLMEMAKDENFDQQSEKDVFKKTFKLINSSLGSSAFKKCSGNSFSGAFLISAYEVISFGVSQNIESLLKSNDSEHTLSNLIHDLWRNDLFTKHAKGGIRGTQRLSNLLPKAESWFKP